MRSERLLDVGELMGARIRMYLWSCMWAETCPTVGDIVLLDGKSDGPESNHDAAIIGARFANEGAMFEPAAPSTSRDNCELIEMCRIGSLRNPCLNPVKFGIVTLGARSAFHVQ